MIKAERLESLSVLANHFHRRSDGTTAADRFYGRRGTDLFEWLLDRALIMDWPTSWSRARQEVGYATSLPDGRGSVDQSVIKPAIPKRRSFCFSGCGFAAPGSPVPCGKPGRLLYRERY